MTVPDPVTVRDARPADAGPAAVLLARHYGTDPTIVAERVAQAVGSGVDHVVVAEDGDGELLGYAKTSWFDQPADPPPGCVPAGWYLSGIVVTPGRRREGIGRALTVPRVERVLSRADRVWYVANARNTASLAMHASLGFVEVGRGVHHPLVEFAGGVGVLAQLTAGRWRHPAAGHGGATDQGRATT